VALAPTGSTAKQSSLKLDILDQPLAAKVTWSEDLMDGGNFLHHLTRELMRVTTCEPRIVTYLLPDEPQQYLSTFFTRLNELRGVVFIGYTHRCNRAALNRSILSHRRAYPRIDFRFAPNVHTKLYTYQTLSYTGARLVENSRTWWVGSQNLYASHTLNLMYKVPSKDHLPCQQLLSHVAAISTKTLPRGTVSTPET